MSMTKTPKRPRDPNQLGKLIVDLGTMDDEELERLQERLERERHTPSEGGVKGPATEAPTSVKGP